MTRRSRTAAGRAAPAAWLTAAVAAAVFAPDANAQPGRPGFGLPPLTTTLNDTPARAELGRRLFIDRRLSRNGTMSCAMCHVPEEGFTSQASQLALGLEGRSLKRNAPTLLNVAWQTSLFHDGRETSLERQAWQPLLHRDEMGQRDEAVVLKTIARLDGYAAAFQRAFGPRGLTRVTVGEALAAYQRALVAADTPFDRWRFGGDAQALDASAQRGFAIFVGKGGCSACHSVGARDATFTDGRFHVTGAGATRVARYDVPLAPGVQTVVPRDVLVEFGLDGPDDQGRFDATRDARDRRAFKTPSLRNVARTAPYMHDGSLASLDAVVDFYARGGGDTPGRSDHLRPLALDDGERADLVAFLHSLTSPHLDVLVERARR